MDYQTIDRCDCTNCPGTGCQCGCQVVSLASPSTATPPRCACGQGCSCEAAEQGCVCR